MAADELCDCGAATPHPPRRAKQAPHPACLKAALEEGRHAPPPAARKRTVYQLCPCGSSTPHKYRTHRACLLGKGLPGPKRKAADVAPAPSEAAKLGKRKAAEVWRCPACTLENRVGLMRCGECGANRLSYAP